MTTSRATNRARARAVAGLVLSAAVAGALAGCVEIPDHGSIRAVKGSGDTSDEFDKVHVPPGPQKGAQASSIVNGWFEAMTAVPVSTTVAREFLLARAGEVWAPDGGFLTYELKSEPEGLGPLVVAMFRVNEFDARGQWLDTIPTRNVAFDMDVEGTGQWRIRGIRDVGGAKHVDAQQSMIVSNSWFALHAQPLSIYFFSPDDTSVVPEPVYLPSGDQQPTLLARAVMAGPVDPKVEHTFVPSGVTLDAVTVDGDGVADIPLTGLSPDTPPATVKRIATQFAWTLRQIPAVKSVRISVEGVPLRLPDHQPKLDVESVFDVDPAGTSSANWLYGLRDGLAIRVVDGTEQPLSGPFGRRNYGLRDVSVSLAGDKMAGVTRAGDRIMESSVIAAKGTSASAVFTGGEDLLSPAWDPAGRIWLVDRRKNGAVVWVLRAGGRQRVQVPGVSGERVTRFLVSRDGTRFVAAVQGREGDRVVVSRIAAGGGSVRAVDPRTIVAYQDLDHRIRDIGWRSPTEIYYLSAQKSSRTAEIRSAILDGAPSIFDQGTYYAAVDESVQRLISSPREDESLYLQHADDRVEPVAPGGSQIPSGVLALTYVG